jgi:hypothetical protein
VKRAGGKVEVPGELSHQGDEVCARGLPHPISLHRPHIVWRGPHISWRPCRHRSRTDAGAPPSSWS